MNLQQACDALWASHKDALANGEWFPTPHPTLDTLRAIRPERNDELAVISEKEYAQIIVTVAVLREEIDALRQSLKEMLDANLLVPYDTLKAMNADERKRIESAFEMAYNVLAFKRRVEL